ncbi:hypothetical protein AGIG_G13918 [Arapaima gigas]
MAAVCSLERCLTGLTAQPSILRLFTNNLTTENDSSITQAKVCFQKALIARTEKTIEQLSEPQIILTQNCASSPSYSPKPGNLRSSGVQEQVNRRRDCSQYQTEDLRLAIMLRFPF